MYCFDASFGETIAHEQRPGNPRRAVSPRNPSSNEGNSGIKLVECLRSLESLGPVYPLQINPLHGEKHLSTGSGAPDSGGTGTRLRDRRHRFAVIGVFVCGIGPKGDALGRKPGQGGRSDPVKGCLSRRPSPEEPVSGASLSCIRVPRDLLSGGTFCGIMTKKERAGPWTRFPATS